MRALPRLLRRAIGRWEFRGSHQFTPARRGCGVARMTSLRNMAACGGMNTWGGTRCYSRSVFQSGLRYWAGRWPISWAGCDAEDLGGWRGHRVITRAGTVSANGIRASRRVEQRRLSQQPQDWRLSLPPCARVQSAPAATFARFRCLRGVRQLLRSASSGSRPSAAW